MKEIPFTTAIDRFLEVKLKAVDKLIEELIEPLADIGSPEKLIGKPYETWTPQDLSMLAQIYGKQEPNPLSDLIFKKEYSAVLELEAFER